MPPVLGRPELQLESIEHIKNIYINAVLIEKPVCPKCSANRVHIKHSESNH